MCKDPITTNGLYVAWDIIIEFKIIEYVQAKGDFLHNRKWINSNTGEIFVPTLKYT